MEKRHKLKQLLIIFVPYQNKNLSLILFDPSAFLDNFDLDLICEKIFLNGYKVTSKNDQWTFYEIFYKTIKNKVFAIIGSSCEQLELVKAIFFIGKAIKK